MGATCHITMPRSDNNTCVVQITSAETKGLHPDTGKRKGTFTNLIKRHQFSSSPWRLINYIFPLANTPPICNQRRVFVVRGSPGRGSPIIMVIYPSCNVHC